MPESEDEHDIAIRLVSVKRDVARVPKGDNQFTQLSVVRKRAANKRR
jgi:hypothetical protein